MSGNIGCSMQVSQNTYYVRVYTQCLLDRQQSKYRIKHYTHKTWMYEFKKQS